MHARDANRRHHDELLEAVRQATGAAPRLVERPVAFEPTQRLIRDGTAVGVISESAATDVVEDRRWVPFAEPAPRSEVAMVLPEGPLVPVADRFERIAVAAAAGRGWLDG